MENNKNLSIINKMALIVIGVVIGGFIAAYTGFTLPELNTHAIEYLYSYSTGTTDVANAEWKIVFYVRNTSNAPLMLTNVYVDDEEAQKYGLLHGESLDLGTIIGTNLPHDGYKLEGRKGVEIFLWIREDFYEPGEEVFVSLNRASIFTEKISVTLYPGGVVEVKKYIKV